MEQRRRSSSMPQVTGTTTLCAILADPIHHVRLPHVFNTLMAQHGKDVVLVPVHVAADDLDRTVDGLRPIRNLAGFAVTVPHKSAVLALCDEASERAVAAGAVNIVRREADGRLTGDNLDGIGFVEGLRQTGVEPSGMRAFVAGAGGAAKSIALALAEAGIGQLAIWNRTQAKAEALRERVRNAYPNLTVEIACDDPIGADLIVNATSLGLRKGDPPPFDFAKLEPGQVVAEIIMNPVMTPLLRAAEARGCRICLGAPMLDRQLAMMADFMRRPVGEPGKE